MDKNLKKSGQPFLVFVIYPGKKKVKTRNICIAEPRERVSRSQIAKVRVSKVKSPEQR